MAEHWIDKTRNSQLVVLVVLGAVYAALEIRGQQPPPMLSQAFIAALGTFVAGRGISATQKGGADEPAG
jgi:hypothetical protein